MKQRFQVFTICLDADGNWSFDGFGPDGYGTTTVGGGWSGLSDVLKLIKICADQYKDVS